VTVINILVVSHGDLGDALIRAAEMIAGPAEHVFSVALLPGESPSGFGDKLAATLRPLDGQDTLVFIDLFGGTPYNVAARQVLKKNVECVTGANLPMLLEAIMAADDSPLAALAQSLAESGQASIKNLGPLLRKVQAP